MDMAYPNQIRLALYHLGRTGMDQPVRTVPSSHQGTQQPLEEGWRNSG
jgi:hypothetical protein